MIEELERIGRELDTTVARVAFAWVQARPGVASTIIGARTLAQLDDNLKALRVQLRPEQTAALGGLTQPKLNFPAESSSLTPSWAGRPLIRAAWIARLPRQRG